MDINTERENYISPSKRALATAIDMTIVLVIRVFVMQILGNLWLNPLIKKFESDFTNHFGGSVVKDNPEHVQFLMHHEIFTAAIIVNLILLAIGVFYHSYLNSSNWCATTGKRLLGFVIVKKNYKKIDFFQALGHYFSSLLPVAYVFYILFFVQQTGLDLYSAITSSLLTLSVGIFMAMWLNLAFFTKKKTTAYDVICGVVFVKARTSAKYPWSKV